MFSMDLVCALYGSRMDLVWPIARGELGYGSG